MTDLLFGFSLLLLLLELFGTTSGRRLLLLLLNAGAFLLESVSLLDLLALRLFDTRSTTSSSVFTFGPLDVLDSRSQRSRLDDGRWRLVTISADPPVDVRSSLLLQLLASSTQTNQSVSMWPFDGAFRSHDDSG